MTSAEEHGSQVSGRDELPLPDYDHLPLPALTSRIRTLEAAGLEMLLAYESQHGNRLPVVQALEARLEALRKGEQPSGGSPLGKTPETAPPPAGTTPASPATTGPPMNPPSHGTPTNPAQPRSGG